MSRSRLLTPAEGEAAGNAIAEALVERGRARAEERAGRSMEFLDWSLKVPEPKAGKLDLDRYPFQRELYAETADLDELVVKKGTQLGVSAYLARWAMYHADVRGATALYVFPKLKQMYDFADARIRESIRKSEYLLSRMPPTSVANKGLRQVGLGWCYFRGSESKDDLDSVDADVLVLDEYDTLIQENIPDAEKRVGGSERGMIRRVGVPSIPGWGIDEHYELSDGRQWEVACDCGERQPLTMDNVWAKDGDPDADEEPRLVCRDCGSPLDRRAGEWVAQRPERRVRGYHLPRLLSPVADLRTILKESRSAKPRVIKVHFNKNLGEAHAETEGRLSDDAYASCVRDRLAFRDSYTGKGLVTAGIDVASARDLHVRVSLWGEDGLRTMLWCGELPDFRAVDRLMRDYDVKSACIDHLPEGRLARAICQRFAGRAHLVVFATNQNRVLDYDPDERMAKVRRTELIDALLDDYRQQGTVMPERWSGGGAGAVGDPEEHRRHLQAAVRLAERDPETDKRTVEYRMTGPVDFLMADAYDLLAGELHGVLKGAGRVARGDTFSLDDELDFERSALDHTEETSYDDEHVDRYEPGFE